MINLAINGIIFVRLDSVFKLVHGLIKILRNERLKRLLTKAPKFLSLVALGTLADMVPLTAENRILTSFGLKHLRFRPSTGLKSLIQLADSTRTTLLIQKI